MARRSFSLMLAWRYLNPQRALLSAVALISVTGVMLGVLVLVVVMSVYSGLEREVKGRLLGFIPHIRLDYAPMGTMRMPVADWREVSERVGEVDGVSEAGPYVQDSVLIDIEGFRRAGVFRGIDTGDPREVAAIEAMLDLEEHPGGSADMGLDDRVVISSGIARAFGTGVGGTIQLLTLRNFEQVEAVFEATKRPPVREEFAVELAEAKRIAAESWREVEGRDALPTEAWNGIYAELLGVHDAGIREPERQIVWRAIVLMDSAEDRDELQLFGAGAREELAGILAELEETDVEAMDAETLKGIEEFVLPKEAEIVGVYQSSQMAMTPDVFVPLHLGQELAGIGDAVQGVSVRLDDPYRAGLVAQRLFEMLPADWFPVTWISELSDFSRLIEQQRVMMYFALSFIILVSAFSMTAVMFTVTIQKRREIGVMKALGAAPGQIVRVFLYQGMILGAAGALCGVGLGLLVIQFREPIQRALRGMGFDPFPAAFNGFTVLPAHVNPVEVAVIGLLAFLLCAAASLLPAFFAARSDAAKSLRNL